MHVFNLKAKQAFDAQRNIERILGRATEEKCRERLLEQDQSSYGEDTARPHKGVAKQTPIGNRALRTFIISAVPKRRVVTRRDVVIPVNRRSLLFQPRIDPGGPTQGECVGIITRDPHLGP